MAPFAVSEEAEHGDRNIQKPEIERRTMKIGGGNATGITPGCISALSNIITAVSMMKRE